MKNDKLVTEIVIKILLNVKGRLTEYSHLASIIHIYMSIVDIYAAVLKQDYIYSVQQTELLYVNNVFILC